MKVLYCYIAINAQGNKVHIDSFMSSFASLGEEIIDGGITVTPFTEDKSKWSVWRKLLAKLKWMGRNVSHLLRLSWLAFRFRPDVLLFRFVPDHSMFLAMFCLSFFYPVVLEVNAIRLVEVQTNLKWLSNVLDKLLMGRVRRFFVVSRLLKDLMVRDMKVHEEKIAVIENGVDVKIFNSRISSDQAKKALGLERAFVVGFVGAFMPWHGVDVLVDLAERMDEVDIKFLLVGAGGRKESCEEQVRIRGLQDRVLFTGHVPHSRVPETIAAMDAVMAPFPRTYYERRGGFFGSALKIFEYMAMAKPVIAPPLGQIKEVIVDGESGILIYSEDTAALKEALLRLYHDKAYRERLGINARKRVEENYTWRANAEKVRRLCNAALNDRA